jgi:hypothetical protein
LIFISGDISLRRRAVSARKKSVSCYYVGHRPAQKKKSGDLKLADRSLSTI